MTSDQIAFAYMVATFVAVGLGMGGGMNRPVAGCAVLVGLTYVLSALSHWLTSLYGLPQLVGFMAYPVIDTIGALTATALWRATGVRWTWWLALCFWLQIGLAAGFGGTAWQVYGDAVFGNEPPTAFAALFYSYKSLNNLLFLAELGLIGGVGGRHVLERLRDWLVDFRGRNPVPLRRPGHPSASEGA